METIKVILVISMLSVLVGCASKHSPEQIQFTSYEDFQPGPEGGIDLVWANPSYNAVETLKAKLKGYDSVVVDQVVVVADENTDASDEEIREITGYLVFKIKEKIAAFKPVIEEPNGRTLRLSIALSNIESPNPVLAFTSSILPFGVAISSISKVTTGSHTNVGQASVELLVSDAQTGEQVFAAIDTQRGNKDISTIIDPMDDARDAVDYWVNRLGITLSDWRHPSEDEASIGDIFSGN